MSNTFEVTVDDVLNVVHRLGKKVTDLKAEELFDDLDQFKIEIQALSVNELDEQINLAYAEIEKQIKDKI